MQLPSCLHRSGDIIPTLNDGSRNVAYLIHIVKEIVVYWEPASVNITLTELEIKIEVVQRIGSLMETKKHYLHYHT